MMKHSLSMIKYLFMNYLPIFSRWLWKYVVYIINISLLWQIIGSHFRWYLSTIFSFQPTKYSLSATDWVRNPPTLLQIIRKSLFFFQQCRTLCNIKPVALGVSDRKANLLTGLRWYWICPSCQRHQNTVSEICMIL